MMTPVSHPRLRKLHSVDVTYVSYGAWQKRVVHTSPPTTGPNLDTFGNSSEQGGIGRDQPVC